MHTVLTVFFIPVLLVFVWFTATAYSIIQLDPSFSILSYNHSKKDFTELPFRKILRGMQVSGEFTAEENNLGIIAVRFRSYQRVAYDDEDNIIFRLKEKNAHDWYYQHTYKSGLFYLVPFYPFGFPEIADSKNKTYVFDIVSTQGNDYNAVSIGSREPILAAKYKENMSKLLENKKEMFLFLSRKFLNAFQLVDIQFFSFVYFLPLILYFLLLFRIKYVFLVRLLAVFDYFLFLLIIIDLFYVQIQSELFYFFVLILLSVVALLNKKTGYRYLTAGFLFLLFCPFIALVKMDALEEKSASWAFLLLSVCVFQAGVYLQKKHSF